MTAPSGAAPRLPLRILLRYGAGQVGGQMFRDAPAALLPLFVTTSPHAINGILACYSLIPASIAALSLAAFALYRRAQAAAFAA